MIENSSESVWFGTSQLILLHRPSYQLPIFDIIPKAVFPVVY